MAKAPKKPADDQVDDRPLWRVNEKSFIGHSTAEEGAQVLYEPEDDGQVGENLSPLNDAAQAIVDAQSAPHPDKSTGKKHRSAKALADAAAADVGDAGGEGDDDLS